MQKQFVRSSFYLENLLAFGAVYLFHKARLKLKLWKERFALRQAQLLFWSVVSKVWKVTISTNRRWQPLSVLRTTVVGCDICRYFRSKKCRFGITNMTLEKYTHSSPLTRSGMYRIKVNQPSKAFLYEVSFCILLFEAKLSSFKFIIMNLI